MDTTERPSNIGQEFQYKTMTGFFIHDDPATKADTVDYVGGLQNTYY